MPIGRYRKFDGEKYFRAYIKLSKSMAKSVAKLERGRGCKARIVQDRVGKHYVFLKCKRK